MRTPRVTPENILAPHTPAVRKLCERLRKLVKQTVPDATETAYPVWHAIGYCHPEAGYFCGIFPYADHVKLYFEFGILLDDPDALLEGQGSRTRYVFVQNTREIRVRSLKRFLMQATSLPIRKAIKER
jgi:hypothetical protein